MMEEFTLSWAAAAMRATVAGSAACDQAIHSICTDSRQAGPGALFFALKGDNTDGHAYVPQALSMGAIAVVAKRRAAGSGTGIETETAPLIAHPR